MNRPANQTTITTCKFCLQDIEDILLPFPNPPREPDPEDCCGTGCTPCVFDTYELRLQQHPERVEQIIAKRAEKLQQLAAENKHTSHRALRQSLTIMGSVSSTPTSPINTIYESSSSSGSLRPLLSKKEDAELKITSKTEAGRNTYVFGLEIPRGTYVDLPISSHIQIRHSTGQRIIQRSYTPLTVGLQLQKQFELLIKIYPEGKLTPLLEEKEPGDTMIIRGPFTKMEYVENQYSTIGMIAAGTGITPMLQFCSALLPDELDSTQISLMFANRSEQDILCLPELESFSELYSEKFIVNHYLSQESSDSDEYHSGRIEITDVEQHMPPPEETDALILVCGPKDFNVTMKEYLKELGYESSQYKVF